MSNLGQVNKCLANLSIANQEIFQVFYRNEYTLFLNNELLKTLRLSLFF